MAESSAMNSNNHIGESKSAAETGDDGVKTELEVSVKREPHECAVCAARAADTLELCAARTLSGTALADFLCKFTRCDVIADGSRHVCRSCHQLIDVLEQAQIEYFKLKDAFEAIISKNPLFDAHQLSSVKVEVNTDTYGQPELSDDNSEDEPLAVTKKKRKVVKRKKKVFSAPKRKRQTKTSSRESWECSTCGMRGGSGGTMALAAHQLAVHTLDGDSPVLRSVKKEDTIDFGTHVITESRSESSQYHNEFDDMFKIEMEDDFNEDGDDSDNFVPDDEFSEGERKARSVAARPRKSKHLSMKPRKKGTKVVHQCEQCDAKYTSIRKLEQHREKHAEGKPPYICEVCGAHYKHKRACDIHVALHKGISDWKCEECNKLFPSKGALQRHNNIHTGKLNYQCDLCGKSFIHTSSFKMHKLSHSGVKPHACDVCGLALMTRSHLKRHKRIHSGEKRHECAVCGKRFSERYNLAAHSKSHETSGEATPTPVLQPRRRLFRCPYCQERYERRYMLERHVTAAHGRTLERAPPTPRNTMSKLLKAQAQGRTALPPLGPPPAPPATPADTPAGTPLSDVADSKGERSPEARALSFTHKLQLAGPAAAALAGSWSAAYAEFGLRHDFSH